MRFTMARPEVSCHPEIAARGRADGDLGGALLLRAGPRAGSRAKAGCRATPGATTMPLLRDRLDALGRRLGGVYRVLVDANHHVDRAGAERAGVGFIGKNTMLITRTHGSWVVLGTLVTDVELEATPPVPPGCGSCTLCIDACPTDALDEPGVLDSTRCLAYWTQTPGEMPDDVMDALEDRVYGCDICQDVCPWNRGIEKRRSGAELQHDAQPTVSLVDWLTRDETDLVDELERLYVPKNEARWLRRNALVALGNVGDQEDVPVLASATRTTRSPRCARRPRGRSHGSHAREGRGRDLRAAPHPRPRAPEPRGGADRSGGRRGRGSRPRTTIAGSSSSGSRLRVTSSGCSPTPSTSPSGSSLSTSSSWPRGSARPPSRSGPTAWPESRAIPHAFDRPSGTSSRTACDTERSSSSTSRRATGARDRRFGRRAGGRRGARSVCPGRRDGGLDGLRPLAEPRDRGGARRLARARRGLARRARFRLALPSASAAR